MLRTHNCGELSLENLNNEVTLSGWVGNKRELGPFLFIMIYDRYGQTQVVFNDPDMVAEAKKIGLENVIQVTGTVIDRGDNRTDKYSTGDIEVDVTSFKVLSESKPMPYDHRKEAADTIKLKYRYLDIRKSQIRQNLINRAKVTKIVHDYMDRHGFVDTETPMLNKSTPEGARDFLVPSRISKGSFYALPQSPQIFKQILMISGMDRYYQIVKCFRDEDLRADRQPEFTQIDIEMSFIDESDIMGMTEGLVREIFSKVKGMEIPNPIATIPYADAMERFGTDAPDMRYGMELISLDEIFAESEFSAFRTASEDRRMAIKAIVLEGKASEFSRNKVKKLEKEVQGDGAKGLAFIKKVDGELESTLLKFFSDEEKAKLSELISEGSIMFIVADSRRVALTVTGNLRKRLAKEYALYKEDDFAFVWVTDFPAFEYDEDENRWVTPHHPFTDFIDEGEKEDLSKIMSRAYDLVINGSEVGGGSIRIHDFEKQKKVFKLLKISEEEARLKFGFLLDALEYGTPPHGGFAFGLDRLIMILFGIDNIRDVIAFPKTTSASCLMSEAPSEVSLDQLDELGIALKAD